MPFRGRVAAIGFVGGILVVTIGLLISGWFLGLGLSQRLDRTSATLINLVFALTPAAIVVAVGHLKTPVIPIATLAILLVVMLATANLHAAVWVGPQLRMGSAARLLTVLSALIWPALAVGALGAAISRRTGDRFAGTASLAGPIAVVAVQTSLAWFVIRLLAGMVPIWLIVLIIVSIGVLLQFVLESEVALLIVRRAAIAVPPTAAKVKSEVEALTQTAADGPVVVDRGEEMTAEIRWRLFGRPVLILSAAMARLDATALMAVIAHEYAHVSLGHLRMRLWLSVGSSLLLVAAITTLAQASGLGSAPQPVAMFLVVTVALIGQRLTLYAYIRRQERDADNFAVSVSGADAMRAALRVTSTGPVVPSGFSTWMTHDSLESRRRALEDRVP